ncbi:MAG: chromate transporter [Bacilli bacterium]|nr:chromate transporter [Bacilli bacterium]
MVYFELFYVFFLIGLFTFGGGYAMIPMIQNEVVGRGWINEGTLSNFIAISEATPGPFAINISTFVGNHVGGVFGAICSTLGVVTPSFIIIILVFLILRKIIQTKAVQGALNGVRPVIVALILATAIMFFLKLAFYSGEDLFQTDFNIDRISLTLLLSLGVFLIIYKKVQKKNLNPILLLCLSAVLGIVLFI